MQLINHIFYGVLVDQINTFYFENLREHYKTLNWHTGIHCY